MIRICIHHTDFPPTMPPQLQKSDPFDEAFHAYINYDVFFSGLFFTEEQLRLLCDEYDIPEISHQYNSPLDSLTIYFDPRDCLDAPEFVPIKHFIVKDDGSKVPTEGYALIAKVHVVKPGTKLTAAHHDAGRATRDYISFWIPSSFLSKHRLRFLSAMYPIREMRAFKPRQAICFCALTSHPVQPCRAYSGNCGQGFEGIREDF